MSKQRILAISDIHGCADLLVAILEQARYQPESDQLILLGDYIDRGDKSYETVQLVKSLIQGGAIALMGNHEDMAIQAIESDGIEQWFANGGRYTIWSYRQNHAFVEDDIDFFKSLPLYHETEDFIFVHAGLDPEEPLPETNDRDTLLWIREDWLQCDYPGKPVIFGHTPARTVTCNERGTKIGIDTGAVFWGTLSCLEMPTMRVYTTNREKRSLSVKA